jgi:hypothetical protein
MTRPTWDQRIDPYITALPRPVKWAIAIPIGIAGLLATGVLMAGMAVQGWKAHPRKTAR